jgi:predicted KAP-like P-loop ATPase
LIKLTNAALKKQLPTDGSPSKYIFVEFNAWLYQGYDDARAALLDVVADRLEVEAIARERGIDKVKDFLGRVRWLRLAGLVALPAAAVAMGLPPVGLAGGAASLVQTMLSDTPKAEDLEQASELGKDAIDTAKGLVEPKLASSPPKQIQALRDSFESALEEIGVTLVVLIDDLDRCLPEIAISTLEAIRLLLFLGRTAFVIAADDEMIRYAVRKHFGDLSDEALVTNYFDKLIQIPIRVPALGTQEVRAYLMMLYVDGDPTLDSDTKDVIRKGIAGQLKETWKGKRVDKSFVTTLAEIPAALQANLDTAERIAPLMSTSQKIAGNPRLVKRFLNALSIRSTIAKSQGVSVDQAALAKLLLFERLASPTQYAKLAQAVNGATDGKPTFLEPWEQAISAGNDPQIDTDWNSDFIKEWLGLPPALADSDLRGELYVAREHAPLITAADRLSSEAAALLVAILEYPDQTAAVKVQLAALPRSELSTILDRVLEKAQRENSWGAPKILDACLVLADLESGYGARVAGFLMDRPSSQIEPSVVPRIQGHGWAAQVLQHWLDTPDVSEPVKKAIARAKPRS